MVSSWSNLNPNQLSGVRGKSELKKKTALPMYALYFGMPQYTIDV